MERFPLLGPEEAQWMWDPNVWKCGFMLTLLYATTPAASDLFTSNGVEVGAERNHH